MWRYAKKKTSSTGMTDSVVATICTPHNGPAMVSS